MAEAAKILKILKKTYPKAHCALTFATPWQLLVATILSAQCTDVRVNLVTPKLFAKFPDPEATTKATIPEIIELIRSTGFYNNKAKFIHSAAKKIMSEFGGQVPQKMFELLTIPGVARKTANVVLGVAFNINEGIAVDTHVKRLAQRLGLSTQTTPEKIEIDLMKLMPQAEWELTSTLLIHHGRQICLARNPHCEVCPLRGLCPSALK